MDRQLVEKTNETQRLINMFTPDLIAGGTLRPKDIIKLFDATNKLIVGIRQQMTKLETDRL